jgi:membrane protease YdiL (CAAX protease family)
MKRLLLALALVLPGAARAVEIPAAGLPAGMGSATPLIGVTPAGLGTFTVMRAYALTLGDALPNRAAWEALPKDAALAATPLLGKLPGAFWADALNLERQPPEKRARMRERFLAAHAAAAVDAGKLADAAVANLEAGLKAGTIGHGDLSVLESQLRWLSVYGGRAEERYQEVRRAAAESRQRKVDAALAKAGFAPAPQDDAAPVPGAQPPRRPLLSKPAVNRLGRAAAWTGAGMLAVSAAATFHPGLLHGPEHLPGLLTWGGAAALGVGRWLGPAKAHAAAAAAAGKAAAVKLPAWLAARIKTFMALSVAARASAQAEAKLEAKVGDGRFSAFWTWLRAGARTGLYWFPLSLLGMLGGNIAAAPFHILDAHAAAASAPDTSAVAAIPFWELINGYAAQMVLSELLLLGVVFRGVRWAAAKVVGDGKAAWIAGAVSLAAAFAGLALTGYPMGLAPAVLGAEAVMIALYASTRTLLAPGLARLGFALMAVESTRMMAFLEAKSLPGALPGLPDWAGLAVAGLLGVFFLLKPLKAQAARLKDLGLWWSKPAADGAPKKASPMVSAGLMWAVPVYLAMEAAFRAVHAVVPQAEPTPEILHRMLLMPLDVILFNFVIVAALEEWVFRRGVFKPMVERVKKWGAPSKWWFWPAAVASALIFSGAHYVDWGAMLAHLGIGGGSPQLGSSLAGAYAFTWASFVARAVGGLVLAWLYAASGSLLLPMIAHFGSNTLEALGMRWGLWPFLGTIAVVLAAQWLKAARVPKE